jgi:hypothetical protein
VWDQLALTDEQFPKLCECDLQDVKHVDAAVCKLNDDHLWLSDALDRCVDLDSLPKRTLSFFGYVSIMESLLTHQPDRKDPSDSITRQIRQKMLLIGRRSTLPIPYELFGVSDLRAC